MIQNGNDKIRLTKNCAPTFNTQPIIFCGEPFANIILQLQNFICERFSTGHYVVW